MWTLCTLVLSCVLVYCFHVTLYLRCVGEIEFTWNTFRAFLKRNTADCSFTHLPSDMVGEVVFPPELHVAMIAPELSFIGVYQCVSVQFVFSGEGLPTFTTWVGV